MRLNNDFYHQSESLDPRDMRREFITGFYSTAGEAVITSNKAVLWTDGRYHIQADHQLDCNWMLMKRGREEVSFGWSCFQNFTIRCEM